MKRKMVKSSSQNGFNIGIVIIDCENFVKLELFWSSFSKDMKIFKMRLERINPPWKWCRQRFHFFSSSISFLLLSFFKQKKFLCVCRKMLYFVMFSREENNTTFQMGLFSMLSNWFRKSKKRRKIIFSSQMKYLKIERQIKIEQKLKKKRNDIEERVLWNDDHCIVHSKDLCRKLSVLDRTICLSSILFFPLLLLLFFFSFHYFSLFLFVWKNTNRTIFFMFGKLQFITVREFLGCRAVYAWKKTNEFSIWKRKVFIFTILEWDETIFIPLCDDENLYFLIFFYFSFPFIHIVSNTDFIKKKLEMRKTK